MRVCCVFSGLFSGLRAAYLFFLLSVGYTHTHEDSFTHAQTHIHGAAFLCCFLSRHRHTLAHTQAPGDKDGVVSGPLQYRKTMVRLCVCVCVLGVRVCVCVRCVRVWVVCGYVFYCMCAVCWFRECICVHFRLGPYSKPLSGLLAVQDQLSVIWDRLEQTNVLFVCVCVYALTRVCVCVFLYLFVIALPEVTPSTSFSSLAPSLLRSFALSLSRSALLHAFTHAFTLSRVHSCFHSFIQ